MSRAVTRIMSKIQVDPVVTPRPEPTPPLPEGATPWRDSVQGPASLQPTAAEHERDAILAKEEKDRVDERAREAYVATKDGELPPAAQTLEEARTARDEAQRKADEEKDLKKNG